jgi:alpha-D-ribose 1-methylphosphonate 5-triphosphate synthase subunit PhnL
LLTAKIPAKLLIDITKILGDDMKPLLQINNLGKSFIIHDLKKNIRACHDVSINLDHGEFVGITGKSGSGKSTILKMIYRTYLPETGEVYYDSSEFGWINLSTANEQQIIYLRKKEIGYVSQFLNIIPRTTARSIIEQAALDIGWSQEKAYNEAILMLKHFELDKELWDSYINTFSGGEKLRLNIARAMVTRPRLLLLDEPTASLDSHSKNKVRQLIEKLKNEGTTMLGIFHDIEFMEGLCDKEYSMDQGSLVIS